MEFALVSGLLCLLLFGIIEVGLLFGDQALVGAAAREAARSAAVGDPTATAQSRGVSGGAGLPLSAANIVLEKSADGVAWAALGQRGGEERRRFQRQPRPRDCDVQPPAGHVLRLHRRHEDPDGQIGDAP